MLALATEIALDTLGQRLEARLTVEGVDCRFLRRTAKATPLAMVDVDAGGIPRYAFYGLDDCAYHPDPATVDAVRDTLLGVHVGSIPIVSRRSADHLLTLLDALPSNTAISFDPNIRLAIEPSVGRWRDAVEQFRRRAHVIKVSEEDLIGLYGRDVDLDATATKWLGERCVLVAVTRGAAGVTLHSRAAGRLAVPSITVEVADSVGAGDSFQAAMLAWLAEHRRSAPSDIASLTPDQLGNLGGFAVRAAAATCRRKGPELPYRAEVDAMRA